MGQRRGSKKNTTVTAEHTRKNKSEVTPLHPAGTQPSAGRPAGPTHEQIAQRAHEIWVKNGGKHGDDQQHWLEAETQLKQEMGVK